MQFFRDKNLPSRPKRWRVKRQQFDWRVEVLRLIAVRCRRTRPTWGWNTVRCGTVWTASDRRCSAFLLSHCGGTSSAHTHTQSQPASSHTPRVTDIIGPPTEYEALLGAMTPKRLGCIPQNDPCIWIAMNVKTKQTKQTQRQTNIWTKAYRPVYPAH